MAKRTAIIDKATGVVVNVTMADSLEPNYGLHLEFGETCSIGDLFKGRDGQGNAIFERRPEDVA